MAGNWWDAAPVVGGSGDAAPAQGGGDDISAWGPGAVKLPNGNIVRYGPRGGMQVLGQAQGSTGFDAASNTGKYRDEIAKQRAAADGRRLESAQAIEQAAYSNEATADRAGAVLPNTPTGLFAGQRMAIGKALGGTPLALLPGIPNTEQTANLETVEQLGNQGALGQVGELKGPLSDRDVQFIKTLQYSPGASPKQNARVVEGQKWIAKRQAAYASALRTWTEKLGSPSALNGKGVSFDRWWGKYSTDALPAPGLGPRRSPTAGAPRVQAGPYKASNGFTVSEE